MAIKDGILVLKLKLMQIFCESYLFRCFVILFRTRYIFRCKCETRESMPTGSESVCCTEICRGWQKVEVQQPKIQMACITHWASRLSIRLPSVDVWVLQMAYYAYSHPYGTDNHEAHNYICYSLQTLLASLWRNQLKLQAENSLYQLLFVNVSAHSFS